MVRKPMNAIEASKAVSDADGAPALRLAAARSLGDEEVSSALDLLLPLACDGLLPDQVLAELGRSVGRAALRFNRVAEVESTWLRDFATPAYLGYDTEMAIALWNSEHAS
jgi:hypothetical protein